MHEKAVVGVGLPTRYGFQALHECDDWRVDRVADCKKRIMNRIGTTLPSKYGDMRLKGLL